MRRAIIGNIRPRAVRLTPAHVRRIMEELDIADGENDGDPGDTAQRLADDSPTLAKAFAASIGRDWIERTFQSE